MEALITLCAHGVAYTVGRPEFFNAQRWFVRDQQTGVERPLVLNGKEVVDDELGARVSAWRVGLKKHERLMGKPCIQADA